MQPYVRVGQSITYRLQEAAAIPNLGDGLSPMSGYDPFFPTPASASANGAHDVYLVQSPQNPLTLVVDAQTRSIYPSGIQSLSRMFYATSIALPPGTTAKVDVYVPDRNVF